MKSLSISQLRHTIYHYLRNRACSHEEAEDVTHDVFVRLVECGWLSNELNPTKSQRELTRYARCVAKHCLVDQHRRHQTTKRGGNSITVSLDDEATPTHLAMTEDTPAIRAERQEVWHAWERSVARLSRRANRTGKGPFFGQIRVWLVPGQRVECHDGQRLTSAQRVQIHRWKRQLLADVRSELAA